MQCICRNHRRLLRSSRRLLGNRRSRTSRPLAKGVLRANNPSKRMADPLEIAKLAVYLASDDSAYVVGADFLIDAGSRPFRAWAPEARCREWRLQQHERRSKMKTKLQVSKNVTMSKPDEKRQ